MPANNKPGTDWKLVKQRFEAGEPARSISADLRAQGEGPSHVAILKRAEREGWFTPGKVATIGGEKLSKLVAMSETARVVSDPQTKGEKQIAALGRRTPQTMKDILERIRMGASPSIAAQACGIDSAMLSRWRGDDPHFDSAIHMARAELLGEMQGEMPKAARRGDWKAADRILQVAPETREEYRQQQSMGGLTVVINVDRSTQADVIDITPTEVSTHA